MSLARADLESLLRARKLDRTLTSLPISPAFPTGPRGLPAAGDTSDEYATAATGVTAFDARLGGGFPRGQISAIAGARSSGRTSLLLQALAAATARGELAALVDVLDMLDVASAVAAGVDLGRLLWVRGQVRGGGPGGPGVPSTPDPGRDLNHRALDRAIKALTLVLQAGNFGLVVFDAAEAPPRALQQLPFTTWRRLHRLIEGSQTTCLLVGDTPLARSSGGLTVRLTRAVRQGPWESRGARFDGRLFEGLDLEIDVVRPRALRHDLATVPFSTRERHASRL